MAPIFLDVVFKDGNGDLENVETYCAVKSGNRIYAFSQLGWLSVSKNRVGKDPDSGDLSRNGFSIPTMITTVKPGRDCQIEKVRAVSPKVKQVLKLAFA